MDTRIYPCGCQVKPGQAECEIKEPHATIEDFNLRGADGDPGQPGLPFDPEILESYLAAFTPDDQDMEYGDWLRENLKE